MDLAAALVKQIDVNWASGTGAGGFPSGLTLTADTWYHLFIIDETDLSIDAGFDSSLTATNLLTDSGGSFYRRVGSALVDSSSNILGYTQIGGKFRLDSPLLDIDVTNPGTSAVLRTMSTPLGVKVIADMLVGVRGNNPDIGCYLSSPDVDDEAASDTVAPLRTVSGVNSGSITVTQQVSILTNTSSQVRSRFDLSQADTDLVMVTTGWEDERGRDI